MDVLIAPDKFKGSLNALEVCKALEKGVKRNPNINNIFLCPLADGGDGSLDILNYYKDLNKLKTVNGMQSIEKVSEDILKLLT